MRRGEQSVKVGADRIKADITEIEQPRITDHNIKPQRQHNVEQGEIENAHPRAT